jgi:hypothetical protein
MITMDLNKSSRDRWYHFENISAKKIAKNCHLLFKILLIFVKFGS